MHPTPYPELNLILDDFVGSVREILGEVLRRADRTGSPLHYIDNTSRELERSEHCNTLVVRWSLREHGVTLAGPSPESLVDPVPPGALKAEIARVILDWGAELQAQLVPGASLWLQAYTVLSFCRMLHSLEIGRVESEPAAVRWALASLEPRWHGLVRRAWAERPHPSLKVLQKADAAELARTSAFVELAIEQSTPLAAGSVTSCSSESSSSAYR